MPREGHLKTGTDIGVMCLQTKECHRHCRQPPGARGEGIADSFGGSRRNQPSQHLHLGLLTSELWENVFLMLQVTQFVAVCDGIPRKQIHCPEEKGGTVDEKMDARV